MALAPRSPTLGSDRHEAGEQLAHLVSRLHRATRRRIRRSWSQEPLAEAERELLRLVLDRPGVRVQEAASALGLAPNTVSTLIGRLGAAGLLERGVDARDARAARLDLTPAALRRIAEWRDRRQALVGASLESLSAEDRAAILAALPALGRLADRIDGE
jgi:DNA-binding MarR family transcriptional regulator